MMTKLNPTTEYQEHIEFLKWFCYSYPKYNRLLIHYPVGEKRDGYTGIKLKRMAARKGIPDFFLALPRRFSNTDNFRYAGLWLELKSKKGKLTKDQKFYLKEFEDRGYACGVAYGWEEAAKIVKYYLSGF